MNLFWLAKIIPLAILVNSHLANAAKIDCYPTRGATEEKCKALGCVWSPVNHKSNESPLAYEHDLEFNRTDAERLVSEYPPELNIEEPWCYHPDGYEGYKIVSRDHGTLKLVRVRPSALPDDIKHLTVSFESYGHDGTTLRLKIFDSDNQRFEPELPRLQLGEKSKMTDFDYEITDGAYLTIKRKSTGAVIFKTDLKKLIFSNKFIQLNTELDTAVVFGLGEHYDTFIKTANKYRPYSFYHTDKLPLAGGSRSYGSFPFYINLDSNRQYAHGVYLRNSNAMDIVIQADQSITFRPIGGVLDFFILSGPSPLKVIEQYQKLVGLPQLPPRWSLGFHLCRYDYKSLAKVEEVWQRNKKAGIPFEAQWTDIDYMDRHNDFTYDHNKFKGLPEFVDKLHAQKMHYVLLLDPGVSQEDNYRPYSLGQEMDIWVKNASNKALVGKVWNDSGRTVFPDFSNPKSIEYWTILFKEFQSELKFDGAWIDMNDISNFVYGSLDGCPADNPDEKTPYQPGGYDLQTKSLCLSAKHRAGTEFNLHNLYSHYEAIATYKALEAARPNQRPLIISRSSTPGQGHFGGHWSGDVLSNWDYLRWSIPSLIEHSMYGYSLMGSDICGFVGDTNEELCARWSTLGAFYSFVRNHNDDVSKDQDPVALGQVVVDANINALNKRYQLLPYLYTQIHRAHRFGQPAIRSLAHEFYYEHDLDNILKVEDQFMWGEALMISPVTHESTHSVDSYLPTGRWYRSCVRPDKPEFVVPKWIDSTGQWYTTTDVSLTDLVFFYKGGNILPIYPTVKQTIADLVDQPLGLIVALHDASPATGEIYLDSGDNIDGRYTHLIMRFEANKLTIEMDHDEAMKAVGFGHIQIMGVSNNVKSILLDGQPISFARNDHVITLELNDYEVTKDKRAVIELDG